MPPHSSSSSSSSSDDDKKHKKKHDKKNKKRAPGHNEENLIDDEIIVDEEILAADEEIIADDANSKICYNDDPKKNNNINNNSNSKDEDKTNNDDYIFEKPKGLNKRTKIEEVYVIILGICIFLAILSLVIFVFGIMLKANSVGSISIFLIFFGLAACCIFIYGIWAVYYYNCIVIEKGEEHADQSSEREFFNLFIYGAVVVFIFMLITGLCCVIYKEEAHNYIAAVGQNQTDWKRIFGNFKYNDLQSWSGSIFIAIPSFCMVMVLGVCALLYFLYLLMDDYRFVQTLVQFFTLILFTLAAILLYLSIYINGYREIANMQNSMPLWIPVILIVVAAIVLLVSIFGYFSIQQESKQLTFIFAILSGVFTVIMLLSSIGGIVYANRISKDLDGQCKGMIEMIGQDFLKDYVGCEKKYVFNSTSIEDMTKCPKDRIIDAWDITLKLAIDTGIEQLPRYGCYDKMCCTSAHDMLKSKSTYLAILACSVFLLFFFCSFGSLKVYNDLDEGHEKGTKIKNLFSKSNIAIIFLLIIAIGVLAFAFITMPGKPQTNPAENVPDSPSKEIDIPTKIIIKPNSSETFKNDTKKAEKDIKDKTQIDEEKTDCGDKCPIIRYKFSLSTEDGILERNKKADFSKIIIEKEKSEEFKGGKRYLVQFTGNSDILKNYTDYFKFTHDCPLLPSTVIVAVNGEVFPYKDKNATSFIELNEASKVHKNRKLKAKANETATPENKTAENTNSTQTNKTMNVPKPIISSVVTVDPDTNITTTVTEKIENNPNIPQIKISIITAAFDPKTGRTKKSIFTNTTSNSISTIINEEPGKNYNITTKIDFNRIKVGQKFQILSRKMDYSLVNSEDQDIIGTVRKVDYKSRTPITNATVEVSSKDFPQCGKFKALTDATGLFTIKNINSFKETGSKYEIIVAYKNLTSFVQTISAGDLGFSQIIDIGNIDLLDKTMLQRANVNSTVINSLTNMELEDVKVSLLKGYVHIENKLLNKSQETPSTFIQTQTNYDVAKHNLTNEKGIWELRDISPSQYTLLFEKVGFYTESYTIDVIGNMTTNIISVSLTPFVEPGKIRIVLSWPNAPADLDVYSFFRTTSRRKCTVFFGKKKCKGLRLDVDNNMGGRKGAETITINLLENYIYTFIVRKYVDASVNGLGPGEERVDGAPEEDYAKPDVLPNIPIHESKAKLKIFVGGTQQNILSIAVPGSASEDNLLTDSDKEDSKNKKFDWWHVFCLDGSQGLKSLKTVNKLSANNPRNIYCEELYFNEPNFDSPVPRPPPAKTTSFIQLDLEEEKEVKRMRLPKSRNDF